MPTTINLHVQGLALCFLKSDGPGLDSVWNIVFVCDDLHQLGLNHPKGFEPQLRVKGRDVELNFKSASIVPNKSNYDTTAGEMLNISDRDMHGPNGLGRSNLRVRQDREKLKSLGKINNDLVWMKVPNANLKVETNNTDTYWAQEIDETGKDVGPLLSKGMRAKRLLITFDVESELTVTVGDSTGSAFEWKFDVDADVRSYDFEFDNDCGNRCLYNDILDLYDFVTDDSKGKLRRFLCGKSPRTSVAYAEEIALHIMNPQGNCDPVDSDPPPQP